MTHTYACLYYLLVWSTKNRESLITNAIRERLYAYIAGVNTEKGCSLLEIGGIEDHIHMLIQAPQSVSIPELVRVIKVSATHWIAQQDKRLLLFNWQEGYGVFSVSLTHVDKIRRYIRNQEEHHKKQSFEDEYTGFLAAANINYDKRFVLG